MQKREFNTPTLSSNFNLKEEIENYISHWKWFVVGVFVCFAGAYLYLRYTIPQYKATSTILVKDDRKGSMASELSAFSDLGLLSGVKSNVDNEIEVIKSRTLIASTIKDLGLTTAYLNLGRVKSEELYKGSPIQIFFSKTNETFLNSFHNFRISSVDASRFDFYDASGVKMGTFSYGTKFKIETVEAVVMKSGADLWKEE
ncbi:MAG: Wzz/FepE/Etk N-terminal domain-containing protein, partial [Flavobacterium sp.]|nr:Wzz/FepE/Etk N-terminal domain-containing protein [Flavobacterium sp.]